MTKSLITVNEQVLTEQDFMASIDGVIEELNSTGDLRKATKVLNTLDRLDNVAGHGKARLLMGLYTWHTAHKPEENFFDYIESTTTTKGITAQRYVLVQEKLEKGDIPKSVASRPMRDLVPIAKCLAQGYKIDEKGWSKIALCANDRELGDVLRKIKGKSERKSARVIKLMRDGSLVGWKNNEKYFLGFLNIAEAENDKVLAEFIEKIKISSGIIEE